MRSLQHLLVQRRQRSSYNMLTNLKSIIIMVTLTGAFDEVLAITTNPGSDQNCWLYAAKLGRRVLIFVTG